MKMNYKTSMVRNLIPLVLVAVLAFLLGRITAPETQESPIDIPVSSSTQISSRSEAESPDSNQLKIEKARINLIEAEIPSAEHNSDGTIERVGQLKRMLVLYPNLLIPELKLLDDEAWFNSAKRMKEDSDIEAMKALQGLRQMASSRFVIETIDKALKIYMEENNGSVPVDPTDLSVYIDDPDLKQVLERYRFCNDTEYIYEEVPLHGFWNATILKIGKGGSTFMGPPDHWKETVLNDAISKFRAENGYDPTDAEQVEPYFSYPTPIEEIESHLKRIENKD